MRCGACAIKEPASKSHGTRSPSSLSSSQASHVVYDGTRKNNEGSPAISFFFRKFPYKINSLLK